MKLIIDTNVLIALEPTSHQNIEPGTTAAATLARLVTEGRHQLYVHPAVKVDLANDTDGPRRTTRQTLVKKYPVLPDPPGLLQDLASALGNPAHATNDWVDAQLLAAIRANAADYLITEDRPLRRKAVRNGLEQRVVSIDEAIEILHGLFDRTPPPPPAVKSVKAHVLDEKDPIFDSFRADYPGFDEWLDRCKLQHRNTWIIEGQDSRLGAVVIVKPEEQSEHGVGRTLKICSFKVADAQKGRRLGELLLKTVFQYARENRFWSLYVTAFEKHAGLVELFEDFGFANDGTRARGGDLVFVKRMASADTEAPNLDALDFHRRLGPYALRLTGVPIYVVPIQPKYHRLLFPDLEQQGELMAGRHPFGNSIRKAYLCHASIRNLVPGAALMFYRSKEMPGVTCLGVLEETLVSQSPDEVARFVGKRTVYAFDEIKKMCNREVLALLFRQARAVEPLVKLAELRSNGALSAAPQSITNIRKEGAPWLGKHLAASH